MSTASKLSAQQAPTCIPACLLLCLRFLQGDIAICCLLLSRTCQPASATQAWLSSISTCRRLSLWGPSIRECHKYWGSTHATILTASCFSQVPHWHQTLWAAQSTQLQPGSEERKAAVLQSHQHLQVYPTQGLRTWLVYWFAANEHATAQQHRDGRAVSQTRAMSPADSPACKYQPHHSAAV